MGLRFRFSLILALLVILAIVLSAWLGNIQARSSLERETDEYLVEQIPNVPLIGLGIFSSLEPDTPSGGGFAFPPLPPPPPGETIETLSRGDWFFAVVFDDGDIYQESEQSPVPVSVEDVDTAANGGKRSFRTETVGSVKLRILTEPESGGAILIARSIDTIDGALDSLLIRVIILGVIIAGVIGVLGWLGSIWIISPLRRMSRAAEQIAENQSLEVTDNLKRQGGKHELGKLTRAFNSMLLALRFSRRQQEQLVDDAGHELKTPLTSIRLNLDLLLKKGEDELSDEERRHLLEVVSEEVEVFSKLTEDLIDISRAGVLDEEEQEELTLAEIVDYVSDISARRWGKELQLDIGESPLLTGSRRMLERAVLNMVGNAVKYTPQEKNIKVSVRGTLLEVSDEGPGVPEDELEHIFDRFYRGSDPQLTPGSGLGLAIVQDIVKSHKGECWAKNRVSEAGEIEGLIVGFEI